MSGIATFVAEGRRGPRPWEQLTGQIYLGSEQFVAQHQPNRVIREIPRRQTQAQQPSLHKLFEQKGNLARLIHQAYRQYGYRLAVIADHLGSHAARVSRYLADLPSAYSVESLGSIEGFISWQGTARWSPES